MVIVWVDWWNSWMLSCFLSLVMVLLIVDEDSFICWFVSLKLCSLVVCIKVVIVLMFLVWIFMILFCFVKFRKVVYLLCLRYVLVKCGMGSVYFMIIWFVFVWGWCFFFLRRFMMFVDDLFKLLLFFYGLVMCNCFMFVLLIN